MGAYYRWVLSTDGCEAFIERQVQEDIAALGIEQSISKWKLGI